MLKIIINYQLIMSRMQKKNNNIGNIGDQKEHLLEKIKF